MPSQRRLYRAARGGFAGREWYEVAVVAAILCVGVLLLSTFTLYSLSQRQQIGEWHQTTCKSSQMLTQIDVIKGCGVRS